ncbi:MAG: ACT domain-containing protein, partial [Pseudomonadota bacterium]
RLLASMAPELGDETWVFATVPPGASAPDALMRYEEAEGTTLILTRAAAEAAGLAHVFPCRRITLNVHSALDAVGFLAAIVPALAAAGMGVNPVAGFHHDHLFVPEERAADAMAILRGLSAEAARSL